MWASARPAGAEGAQARWTLDLQVGARATVRVRAGDGTAKGQEQTSAGSFQTCDGRDWALLCTMPCVASVAYASFGALRCV